MRPLPLLIAFLMLIAPLASTTALARSSKSSPIRVTAEPLPLKQNEEGALKVGIVALVALERLEVAVKPSTGVELVRAVPPLTLSNLKAGERHEFVVPVRLMTPDFGYIVIDGKATTSAVTRPYNHSLVVGTLPEPPRPSPMAVTGDLSELTLLKVSARTAIVRFGRKEMLIVRIGDRLGRNEAEILEIGGGRIVLDETFVGADGKPNRARVTVREGETGGTRVLIRPGEEPPLAGRQRVVVPAPKKSGN